MYGRFRFESSRASALASHQGESNVGRIHENCVFLLDTKRTHNMLSLMSNLHYQKPFSLTFHLLGGTKMFIKSLRMLLKHLHALSRVDPSFITKNLVIKVGIRIFFNDNQQ